MLHARALNPQTNLKPVPTTTIAKISREIVGLLLNKKQIAMTLIVPINVDELYQYRGV